MSPTEAAPPDNSPATSIKSLIRPRDESAEPAGPEIKKTRLSDEPKPSAVDVDMSEIIDEESTMNAQSAMPVAAVTDEEAIMNQDGPFPDLTKTKPSSSTPSLDYVPLPPSTSLFHPSPRYVFSSAQVGISEYLTSDIKPIEGIIKQRFTDFMVWEITPDGEVLRLKEIGEPHRDGGWKVEEVKKVNAPKEGERTDKTEEKKVDQQEEASSVQNKVADAVETAQETIKAAVEVAATTVTEIKEKVEPVLPDFLKSADPPATTPSEPVIKKETPAPPPPQPTAIVEEKPAPPPVDITTLPTELQFPVTPIWGPNQTAALLTILSSEKIIALHDLFLSGRTPPKPDPTPKADGGWGSRAQKVSTEDEIKAVEEKARREAEKAKREEAKWARDGGGRGGRGGDRGRGGRGGRGGGREPVERGSFGEIVNDAREVLSEIMTDKTARSTFHATIREHFSGTFETFSREIPDQIGSSRIAIKWGKPIVKREHRDHQQANDSAPRGGNGAAAGSSWRDKQPARPKLPQFIHFTMQKANRDTQDCLNTIARNINVPVKSLTTCGTKDKRGVTVQRVCLGRGYKIFVQDVWRGVNGINGNYRNKESAVKTRGERGLRIGDIKYSDEYLDLGMLKGNHFQITLRNVKAENPDHIDQVMNSLKTRGFINYYGMQRFGTAAIATHSIGLALLQGKWQEATEIILAPRDGELPDAIDARKAWIEERDARKALMLMPRRSVAERCLWEFWSRDKSASTDYFGALMTIPRNLRLIYVHAYQSYVWNAVVSQRIRMSADKPIVGDVVYDEEIEEDADGNLVPVNASKKEHGRGARSWESAPSVKVKTLKEEDLDKYTIHDVIVPLPGHSVTFPEGPMFEKTKEIMAMDGLDPLKMRRDQKEYSLGGSYRRIIHLPKRLEWKLMHYNDPDVPLSQSDEDKILNLEPAPVDVEGGQFLAVQLSLSLGTSAYATMALREITKTETSSHHQTLLTEASEDQAYKGGKEGENDEQDQAEGQHDDGDEKTDEVEA